MGLESNSAKVTFESIKRPQGDLCSRKKAFHKTHAFCTLVHTLLENMLEKSMEVRP